MEKWLAVMTSISDFASCACCGRHDAAAADALTPPPLTR
jgi:hypothetical protein